MKVAKGTRLKSSVSITTFWEKGTIRRRQRSEIYAMCSSQITHSSGLGGQGLVREQLLMDAQVQDKWGVSSYREASKELLHRLHLHSEARQLVNNSKRKWKRNGQHIQHIFFRFFHTFFTLLHLLGSGFSSNSRPQPQPRQKFDLQQLSGLKESEQKWGRTTSVNRALYYLAGDRRTRVPYITGVKAKQLINEPDLSLKNTDQGSCTFAKI